ncbi:MAG: sterol desaturase family protein [Pacificimonas sp.]
MTNLLLAGGSLAVASAVQARILAPMLAHDAGRYGVVRRLPADLRGPAAFLMLDWAMYWWHRATHLVPVLWRFHRVHHVDLDMDMSTALRFHAIDQLVSAPMRVAMIVVIGPDEKAHASWNAFFGASVLFHHANISIPRAVEERLALLLTTPRMHGIHHMAVRSATDSNWSSGISLWDRLHGSFRLDLHEDTIRMGVAGYPESVGIGESLALPFRSTEGDWHAPSQT